MTGRRLTFDEYMAGVPPKRRGRLEEMIGHIRAWYPRARIAIKYGMPMFETDGGWVAVANQKNYISLYTCSSEHIAPYKEKHSKVKSGKGCLNFRDSDEIYFEDLKAVVRHAMNAVK
jgi:uncharacterized protein YdhG (YjbR/CyaY superfamily)